MINHIKNLKGISGLAARILVAISLLVGVTACGPNDHKEDADISLLRQVLPALMDSSRRLSNIDVTSPSLLNIPGEKQFESESDFLSYLLDESDTSLIKAQLRQRRSFILDSLSIPEVELVNIKGEKMDSTFWRSIDLGDEIGFYTVSKPIFNRAGTKAYLRIAFRCEGLCGSGYELLLEKSAMGWQIKKRLGDWVS